MISDMIQMIPFVAPLWIVMFILGLYLIIEEKPGEPYNWERYMREMKRKK